MAIQFVHRGSHIRFSRHNLQDQDNLTLPNGNFRPRDPGIVVRHVARFSDYPRWTPSNAKQPKQPAELVSCRWRNIFTRAAMEWDLRVGSRRFPQFTRWGSQTCPSNSDLSISRLNRDRCSTIREGRNPRNSRNDAAVEFRPGHGGPVCRRYDDAQNYNARKFELTGLLQPSSKLRCRSRHHAVSPPRRSTS